MEVEKWEVDTETWEVDTETHNQDQIVSTLKFLREKSTQNEISLDSNDLLKENVKLGIVGQQDTFRICCK